MRKLFCIISILCLSTLSAFAEDYVANHIIVSVNDQIITEYDLNEKVEMLAMRYKQAGQALPQNEMGNIRRQLLDSMIQQMLFAQEVERYGISVDDATVQTEIDRLQAKSGLDQAGLKGQLAKEGLTLTDLQEQIRENIEKQRLLGGMVSRKVIVTDTETREEYEARKQDYYTGGGVHLAIIMVPKNISADDVMAKIKSGELTFKEAALQYSEGPGAENGGDIGRLALSSLDDDWQNALKGMAEGDIKGPVQINGTAVIIHFLGNSEGTYVPFEELKDSIYLELLKKKRERVFAEYLQGLKEKAVIRYMD